MLRLVSTDEPSSVGDILVVDDTSENLVAIEAALQGLSRELVTARSGREALRHLLDRDFALILLDVQMPTMGGLETASMIRSRERNRHVPIIFITAYDRDAAVVLQAYRLGAVDFLYKPIHVDVLRAKASVFVELQRRTAEVAAQAAQIRAHERTVREQALADQRRRLESQALHERLEEERRHAAILLDKNLQLEAAYAELKRINLHLEADDRRKNEFIAVLAHELRNPLVPITAGLDVLADTRDPQTLEHVQPAMRRQVDHLVRLVDDLLDVSRITSDKIELRRERVKPGDFLMRAVEMSRPGIEGRQHTLNVEISDDASVAWVDGDPVRLAQVISNLLNNAARYTDEGGSIDLSCAVEDHRIIVRIADNGRGMPPELIDRAFDMFVQGEAGGGGLGIGLTLVSKMIALHGGDISAKSDGVGRGSTFVVRLPVIAGAPAAEVAAAPSTELIDRALRIAIVEDNADVREMMRFLLEHWGHEVVGEAGTATKGIEMLLTTRPDVALVDIGLPDLSGYDVARSVCSSMGAARPRLVAFSGFNQLDDRRASAEAGFDEHLSKPVRDTQLRRALLAL